MGSARLGRGDLCQNPVWDPVRKTAEVVLWTHICMGVQRQYLFFFSWKTGRLGEKALPKFPKPESSKVEIQSI